MRKQRHIKVNRLTGSLLTGMWRSPAWSDSRVHILKSCVNGPPLRTWASFHLKSSWVLLRLGSSNVEAKGITNISFIVLTSQRHRDRIMAFEGPSEIMGVHALMLQKSGSGSRSQGE